MKFDIKTWLIIGLAAVIVILLLFQRSPEPVEDTRKYDSLIRVVERGELKAIELAEKRKADSLRSIESKQVYEVKVKKLEGRISDLKANPVIIRIREEIPEVDSLIVAYDSTNQVKDERVAQLSSELYNCQKLAASAEDNFQVTIQADKLAREELQEDIQGYKKDLKREKRKGKLLKIFTIIGTVGAFIGGSQL